MFSPSKKDLHLAQQQKQAWMAILGLVISLALLLLLRAGSLLVFVFPASSFAVGVFLYLRYPPLYVGFTWWMLFLAAFVRRLIDYQSGYLTFGPWNLASLLVASISFATLIRQLPKVWSQGGLPFVLSLASVFYAFLIGLVLSNPIDKVGVGFLSWLSPVLFGFHLFANWQDYPRFRQTIQRTFLWGVLVMGTYGILQFCLVPAWEHFYLTDENVSTAFGRPEPFAIRTYSTMGSPFQFAGTMIAGLLLLLGRLGSSISFLGAGVGYLTFLLSRVRSSWLGLCIGLLTFIPSLKSSLQIRIIAVAIVTAGLVLPLTFIEQFSEIIGSRMDTLYNLGDDKALNIRLEAYNLFLGDALSNPIGQGFGSVVDTVKVGYSPGDGIFLIMLFWFGVVGTIFYLSGVFLILFKLFQGKESRFDVFNAAARSIVVGLFPLGGTASLFTGSLGIVFWGFLGIGLAARKYYLHQYIAEIRQSFQQKSS